MAEQPDPVRHAHPAASRGSTRRHRVEGGRQHQVLLRFNDAEYEALTTRATTAGVTVQRLLADGAFASRRPQVSAPAALLAELRRLTASLSNNINQIARWLNSGGRPDARITGALDAVRRAMARLDAVLAWLGAPEPAAPTVPESRTGQPGSHTARAEYPSANAERPRSGGTAIPTQRSADPENPA